MNAFLNAKAHAAVERALRESGIGLQPQAPIKAPSAPKTILRASALLLDALKLLSESERRSQNSELVIAIQERLTGYLRIRSMIASLQATLGPELSELVLSAVPLLESQQCSGYRRLGARFPDGVLEAVRAKCGDPGDSEADRTSMNSWMLGAAVEWVNLRRQQHALLSAVQAIGEDLDEARSLFADAGAAHQESPIGICPGDQPLTGNNRQSRLQEQAE